MTVRINFLPKTYQPPKKLGVKEWAAAVGGALAVVGTTMYYMTAFAGVSRMEQQILAEQARHQKVKASLAQAAEIKAREEKVASAEASLKALQGRHWSGVLLTLGDLTPQTVTWTSVKVDGDKVVLMANSRGLMDVAQLLGGLVDHGEVAEVTLKYVTETGSPVTISARPGDKLSREVMASLSDIREMRFELEITLNPIHEGGRQSSGA